MTIPNDIMTEYFSTSKLLNRPFDNCLEFDNNGIIVEEFKYKINDPTLNIQNSKFIGNPEDKFETMLFLPNNHERKGEGGLRTKGYFKHSYKYIKNDCKNNNKIIPHENKIETGDWYIIDSNDEPLKLVPPEIQQKISNYIASINNEPDELRSTIHENIEYLPLISIITVVYNGARYLEETILSILNQSYPNIEYIVIDGGSTDGTLDIIKRYENDIDYWVSEKDEGIYDAMNKSIKCITGKWILFMGSDDTLFSPYTVELISKYMTSANTIYYGDVIMRPLNKQYCGEISKSKILKKNICHQSIFYPLSVFKKYSYNTKYYIYADYDLNLKCFTNKTIHFQYIPQVIANFNINGISSNKKDDMFAKNFYRIIYNHFGIASAIKIFCWNKMIKLYKRLLNK